MDFETGPIITNTGIMVFLGKFYEVQKNEKLFLQITGNQDDLLQKEAVGNAHIPFTRF